MLSRRKGAAVAGSRKLADIRRTAALGIPASRGMRSLCAVRPNERTALNRPLGKQTAFCDVKLPNLRLRFQFCYKENYSVR